MKIVYANPRAWRVRVAQAAIWLGTTACLWLAFASLTNRGDLEAGQLVAIVGVLIMLSATLAFELFLRLYVIRMARDGDTLLLTTLATLHHRQVRLKAAETSVGATHHERTPFPSRAPVYDNSWRGLRQEGHLFPFVIDTTPPARFDP